MYLNWNSRSCSIILVLFTTLQIVNAITVKPALCPSNKIAPHKKIPSWYNRGRTFNHFYNLFVDDNNGGQGGLNDLQEKPQEDDPDDCGEIEDYDEHDVNSATVRPERRIQVENRHFFHWFDKGPSTPPFFPTQRPPVTQAPPKPTYSPSRPPAGGFFADNNYRPPAHQYPSDSIKPVHESGGEPAINWHPGIIGGQVGHVVGVPARPPRPNFGSVYVQPTRPTVSYYQTSTTIRTPSSQNNVRRPRPRQLDNNNSVIGSFLDLFLK